MFCSIILTSLTPTRLCLKRYAPTITSTTARVRLARLHRMFHTPFLVYVIFQSFHLGNVHRLQKSTWLNLSTNQLQILPSEITCMYLRIHSRVPTILAEVPGRTPTPPNSVLQCLLHFGSIRHLRLFPDLN